MNYYQIFFIFLLISYITTCGPSTGNPKSADDCKDDSILDSRKKLDYTHCCFIDYGIEDYNSCRELTSYQYKNFGKLFKEYNKGGFGYGAYAYDVKVDCISYNLKIYLLSFISLFILF